MQEGREKCRYLLKETELGPRDPAEIIKIKLGPQIVHSYALTGIIKVNSSSTEKLTA